MKTTTTFLIASLLLCAVGSAADTSTPPAGAAATTQSSDLPAPTRVTLHLDHTPAVDALRELFRQADDPVAAQTALTEGFARQMNGVTVTADLVNQPYMAALLEICRQSWLEPQFSNMAGGGMRLALRRPRVAVPRLARLPRAPAASSQPATTRATTRETSRATTREASRATTREASRATTRPPGGAGATTRPSWIDGPSVIAGPFVFVARDARRFSRIDLDADTGPTPVRELDLTLMGLRDPKLRLFAIADALDVDEAIDETGASLIPVVPPGSEPPKPHALPEHMRRANPLNVRVTLAYPPEGSHKIALLRGHLNMTVVTRSEPVEMIKGSKLIEPGTARKAGQIGLVISDLAEAGEGSQMRVKIEYGEEGQAQFDEVRSLINNESVHASDIAVAGGEYRVTVSIHSFTHRTYEGTIQFYPVPPAPPEEVRGPAGAIGRGRPAKIPTSVVWDAPVEAADVSVPVELKDLALP